MRNKVNEELRKYVRDCLCKGHSLSSIEKNLVLYDYEPKFAKELVKEFDIRGHLNKNLLFVFAFLTLALGLLFIKPTFMGYTLFTEQNNFTDTLSLVVNESSNYVWEMENNGNLKRIGISAKFVNYGGGYAKVYLRHDDVDYLVFDSTKAEEIGLDGVTGFVGLNESLEQASVNETELIVNQIEINGTLVNGTIENKSIRLVLDYYNDSNYDINNDGVEASDGVVDLSVSRSGFNFDGSDGLCTRWTVNNVDDDSVNYVCYGAEQCCAFLDLESSSPNWNDTYYSYFEKEEAGYDNVVSAQVVYVYYNISEIEAEIVYSDVSSLPVKFSSPYIEFSDVCVETCLLPELNASSYTLIFEVENSSIEVDSISYTVEKKKIVNNAPKLIKNVSDIGIVKNYTINLSKHFFDEDGDVLVYSYYEADGISVSIDEDIAVISALEFIGVRSMFFIANDSSLTAVSNVFKVNVTEFVKEEVEKINRTRVVIGKPVKWIKRIKLAKKETGIRVNVTKGAFNVSVKDVVNDIEVDKSKIKVVEDNKVKNLEEYENEKEVKREEKEYKERNLITGAVVGLASNEEENVTEIIIEDIVSDVEVEYYTEGPTAEEIEISEHKKIIVVSSDIHYEDILSYTYLPVEANEEAVRLYWLVNGSRQEVSIDKFDTNSNGLVDYVEWIVPSL